MSITTKGPPTESRLLITNTNTVSEITQVNKCDSVNSKKINTTMLPPTIFKWDSFSL